MTAKRGLVWMVYGAAFLMLGACGGSSGGGGGGDAINTSRATVTADNQGQMATAAAEGSKKAVDSSNAPIAVLLDGSDLPLQLARQVRAHLLASSLVVGPTIDVSAQACPNGGVATVTYPDNAGESGSGTSRYSGCQGPGYTINGTAVYRWTNNFENFSYEYDLTVSDGTRSYNLRGTVTCTGGSEFSCSYTEDFSADGRRFRIENVQVSGNNTSGYNVSVRVYDEEFGYVDISATGITICDNGNIGTGQIQVTDSTGNVVLQIDFTNCDQMVVTFDGVGTTLDQ